MFAGVSSLFGWKEVAVFVLLPVALHEPKGCEPGPVPATWLKGRRALGGLRGAGGDWERPSLRAVLGRRRLLGVRLFLSSLQLFFMLPLRSGRCLLTGGSV